jgi:hypothetical protein
MSPKADYHTLFKKGHSANPGDRPATIVEVRAAAQTPLFVASTATIVEGGVATCQSACLPLGALFRMRHVSAEAGSARHCSVRNLRCYCFPNHKGDLNA